MDETQLKSGQVLIDVIYNENMRQFEVWKIDPDNNIKALLMTRTHDDIIQDLRLMAVNVLQTLAFAEAQTKESDK